jgi:DNA-directed RNA polymerase subunit M
VSRRLIELKFCPECGAFCNTDNVKRCYVCPKCGWEEPLEETRLISRENRLEEKIIVVGQKERKLSTMPKVTAKCPKCGNTEAYWWMVQTRGIDESSTQFFRCTECGYTWRDYS